MMNFFSFSSSWFLSFYWSCFWSLSFFNFFFDFLFLFFDFFEVFRCSFGSSETLSCNWCKWFFVIAVFTAFLSKFRDFNSFWGWHSRFSWLNFLLISSNGLISKGFLFLLNLLLFGCLLTFLRFFLRFLLRFWLLRLLIDFKIVGSFTNWL